MAKPRELRFNAFNMTAPSHNWAGLWSHPRDASINYNTLDYWVDYARTAERGLLDGIFLADVFGVYDVYGNSPDTAVTHAVQLPNAEPTLLVSAMALVTKHLGFGITSNLTFEHPYQLARRFSTLDHLTNGRIGWNVVTGYLDSGARGMGLEMSRAHDDRYDAAEDFLTAAGKAAGRTARSAATATRASSPIRQKSTRCGMRDLTIASMVFILPNRHRSGRRCCTRRERRNAAAPSPPDTRRPSFSTARPGQSWRAPFARSEARRKSSAATPTTSGYSPARP
jgi:alkanesulfonate monooxygenase SsuD/methylene tetrahydromethanopterin reductase-like flavin-dependent oxidoreductase (luciferase family)